MAWNDEATEILRILINDWGDEPTYDDNTLGQLLLAAARYVVQEISLSTAYVVDFLGGTITPDPSNDNIFLNFVILRAACLTDRWKFNEQAIIQGVKAKLGVSEINVGNQGGAVLLSLLKDGACKTYDQLKLDYQFGNTDLIRGILSPFISNLFIPNINPGR